MKSEEQGETASSKDKSITTASVQHDTPTEPIALRDSEVGHPDHKTSGTHDWHQQPNKLQERTKGSESIVKTSPSTSTNKATSTSKTGTSPPNDDAVAMSRFEYERKERKKMLNRLNARRKLRQLKTDVDGLKQQQSHLASDNARISLENQKLRELIDVARRCSTTENLTNREDGYSGQEHVSMTQPMQHRDAAHQVNQQGLVATATIATPHSTVHSAGTEYNNMASYYSGGFPPQYMQQLQEERFRSAEQASISQAVPTPGLFHPPQSQLMMMAHTTTASDPARNSFQEQAIQTPPTTQHPENSQQLLGEFSSSRQTAQLFHQFLPQIQSSPQMTAALLSLTSEVDPGMMNLGSTTHGHHHSDGTRIFPQHSSNFAQQQQHQTFQNQTSSIFAPQHPPGNVVQGGTNLSQDVLSSYLQGLSEGSVTGGAGDDVLHDDLESSIAVLSQQQQQLLQATAEGGVGNLSQVRVNPTSLLAPQHSSRASALLGARESHGSSLPNTHVQSQQQSSVLAFSTPGSNPNEFQLAHFRSPTSSNDVQNQDKKDGRQSGMHDYPK